MTSLTGRLGGKSTGQAIEYEEELVHNALSVAQNAIVLVAKKVEHNVLYIITAPVIVLQPTVPQNPAANLPNALLKVTNTLVIK